VSEAVIKLIKLLKAAKEGKLGSTGLCRVFDCGIIGYLHCDECPFGDLDAIDVLVAELEEAVK